MARDLIELHGLVPQRDVQIVYTGLGPGEKLEEELFFAHERPSKTVHDSIWVAIDPDHVRLDLTELRSVPSDDADAVIGALRRLVPDYRPARDAALLADGGRAGLPEV
jgi:FlaA1/EpsC-like NDP-sugar epimerase